MKELVLTFVAVLWLMHTNGQGTVEFANFQAGSPLDAPVYGFDGITKLSGTQFVAELLGGPTSTNLISAATTSFLTGNLAGYFNGGTVAINGVGYGRSAWVQVDVWNTTSGSSFDQAQASGLPDSWWQSSIFSVPTGSPFGIPTPPGVLTGLGTSPVYLNGVVPEPSVFALGALGAVLALFCLNRRTGATSGRHPACRIPP